MRPLAFRSPTWPGALALAAAVVVTPASLRQDPVRPRGVTAAIERTIDRGLQYLVRTQGADGAWRTTGSLGDYPTAMTALAGTALLASGSTTTRGRHWLQARKAVDHLLRTARPEGLIAELAEERLSMFGHGFATLFLAEVYGMEEDVRRQYEIRDVLRRAVELIARSQSRAGGWYYTPQSTDDEGSVTVTQIQALRACRNAGILVPKATVDRAVAYVKNSANPDGGIRYRAGQGGASRPAISAAAVAVLYDSGRYDDPMAERALTFARRTLPIDGSGTQHHFYAQLYLGQSLYQRGGPDWDDHYARIGAWLVDTQRADGSWIGDSVGTTYGTAIAAIVLQLPYAYLPIYQR